MITGNNNVSGVVVQSNPMVLNGTLTAPASDGALSSATTAAVVATSDDSVLVFRVAGELARRHGLHGEQGRRRHAKSTRETL